MTELRLEFQLADFWGGWSQVEDDEEGETGAKLAGSEAPQASLLTEDSTFSLSLSAGMDVSSEPFPCLADELEQQAKALEREWYCPIQPLVPAPSPARLRPVTLLLTSPASVPALRSASLALSRLQQLPPLGCAGALTVPVAVVDEEALGGEKEEGAQEPQPATPTRRSHGHNSSWNESQCALRADPQEVQSPVRPAPLMEPPAGLVGMAPLALAVDNAESVRLGCQPLVPDAWRGCSRDPWCNREARHRGPCNHRAAVPGLLAYSQRQLFESGVNVEELCRAPELVEANLSALCHQQSVSIPVECVPAIPTPFPEGVLLGKRRAMGEADAYADLHQGAAQAQHSRQQAAAAAAALASSGSMPTPQAVSDARSGLSQQGAGTVPERSSSDVQGASAPLLPLRAVRSKRQRPGAEAAAAMEEDAEATQEALSSGGLHSEDSSGHVVTVQLAREPSVAFPCPLEPLLPAALPAAQTAAEQAAPAAAAAAEAIRAGRSGLRAKAGGRHGGRAGLPAPTAYAMPAVAAAASEAEVAQPQQPAEQVAVLQQPAQQQQQQQLKSPSPSSRGARATTPSKQHARQTPKTPDAGPPRSNQRRTILHWNSEQVTDPRSGQVVYSVDPASFCTQCFVTHTPVWRAGPFGHKTLCNACGVRYMKYAKGKK